MRWIHQPGLALLLAGLTVSCRYELIDHGGECGNGVVEGLELCDGVELAGESCVTRGYELGTLACASDCLDFDTSGCADELLPRGGAEVFTFLFWTDQEIDHYDGDANLARLRPAIQAMNAIEGTPYPEAIGGAVAAPDFVASGGDAMRWPTRFCVDTVWDELVHTQLAFPTRAVAGDQDSGGDFSTRRFHDWLRADPFVAAHASDNGQPAWSLTPPDPVDAAVTGTGIIPGINYSFVHKGVVFVMWSPTYHQLDAPAGDSHLSPYDRRWLEAELEEHDPLLPKIVVCHYNGGSILDRQVLDELYARHNVLLHLSGHRQSVQHWQAPVTDYVADAGCAAAPTVSVVRFGRDQLTLAHLQVGGGGWHDLVIDRAIPERWPLAVAVSVQPRDQSVAAGETATFRIRADGEPPLAYQWQIDQGAGWEDIPGAERSSYATPPLAVEQSGAGYRCVVSNPLPSQATSDVATVVVTPAPL